MTCHHTLDPSKLLNVTREERERVANEIYTYINTTKMIEQGGRTSNRCNLSICCYEWVGLLEGMG